MNHCEVERVVILKIKNKIYIRLPGICACEIQDRYFLLILLFQVIKFSLFIKGFHKKKTNKNVNKQGKIYFFSLY